MHPVLFHIGSLPVRSYGVVVLIAFLLALAYATSRVRRDMAGRSPSEPGLITPDHVFDMAIIGLFIGILGTRTVYVVLDWPEFAGHPFDALKIWTGGLSVHGALLFGVPWVAWYSRRHKLSFLQFTDYCAPAFAIGHGIGRIGCFLNGCCYGVACNLPWAVRFEREGTYGSLTPPSHPVQLYSAAFNLSFFVLLDRLSRRPHRRGSITLGYLALFLAGRFVEEIFRKGATADVFVLGLTHAQAFSLVGIPIVGLIYLSLRRRAVIDGLPAADAGAKPAA